MVYFISLLFGARAVAQVPPRPRPACDGGATDREDVLRRRGLITRTLSHMPQSREELGLHAATEVEEL